MAKYSFEFKLKVVKAYLNGECGYRYIAKKFNIPGKTRVEEWVANYRGFGEKGLLSKRKNTKYTLDFKLEVVKYYLTTEISYKELALERGMNSPSLITSWVSKFGKEGVEGLSKSKGWPPKMESKEEKEKIIENTDTSHNIDESDRIKELEKQITYLQIENAYLKELRRLRLEETREMKKQQESFTTSEENSN